MSIEQKIAQLLEEAQKLQAESVESLSEEEQAQYINEAVDHEKMADQHAHHSERHELEASNDGHPDHDHASTAHANAEAAHKEAAKKLKEHGADSDHYKKAAAEAATATRDAKDESSHLRFRKVAKPHRFEEASSYYTKKEMKEETMITEQMHTVEIDHMGGNDEHAKKHNVAIHHHDEDKQTAHATGTKENLRKYLAKHYDSHEDAKEHHPEVFKEEHNISVDVSADVAALINGEELTEEFKTKAATIFEAAVVTRVKAEIAKIEEQFETQLAEQVEQIKEGLVEKVDGYLNYVVEQWMTDNELALENGMKTEIMESFIAGMKNLFMEHYIEVPAEKYDLVGELEEQAEVMKSKLDEQLAANVELSKQVNEMKRTSSIEEFCADLADTDAEKFKGLAEELAYEDVESFKTKLQTIKENYFGKKATPNVSSVVTDDPVQLDEEAKTIDPVMAKYLAALK